MASFHQVYLPGAVALWCAVGFALAALWGYVQLLRGDESFRLFARRAYGFFALAVSLASIVLAMLLLQRDFRIEYVYQYTGLELPTHYQFAAFWAGQKGSFLIWLLFGALLGLLLSRTVGKRDEAPVMGVYTLTLMGLLFILVRDSPFLLLEETPRDGQGLNPLLLDDWMVIHPPVMFVAYSAAAIPFAFAVAAMWRREYDRWARQVFPWALGGFLVLGTAILMGGYWAYKTLGWGGYWGWDPVENASLIPWILSAILIHGLYLERAKGRYRRANLTVACLLYLSVLYGTFLTRSGVLADFSVHSFVDLGISAWLIVLMTFFFSIAVYLLATRIRRVPTQRSEDPLLSRGTFMVLATITLAAAAVVITLGTSAPILTRFMDNPGQVGPEFYNRVNLPVALLLAFLLSLVPFLTWKGSQPRRLLRKLLVPAVAALGITVAALVFAVHEPFHALFIFLASLALASNLAKTIELARRNGLGRAGGYFTHVGVGVMFLGFIASTAYDESAKVTLTQGEPQQVGEMTLTFNRFLPRTPTIKERMEIEVVREDGSRYLAYPKLFMNDRTRQVMARPDIRKYPLLDLYISPIEYDPGRPAGAVERVQLARGESMRAGEVEIRFLGFDLRAEGDAMAQMAAGGSVTVGATLEVASNGDRATLTPLYRFSQSDGRVEAPAEPLPGGGSVTVSGIDAGTGAVFLELVGLSEEQEGRPPQLAVDVTRKPLINLVWYGLYVVLLGGGIALVNRFRQALASP